MLTDFGTITSIQRELDNPLSYKGWPIKFKHIPGGLNANTGSYDLITKRDVWQSGITLFLLLFGESIESFKSWAFTYAKGHLHKLNLLKNSQFEYLWDSKGLNRIYVEKDKQNVEKFVKVIQDMTNPNPRERISAKEAYADLAKITG